MLTSGASKCLACCRAVVAMDKGCCPSGLQDVNVLLVNALDGRVGPVQYRVRCIVKDLLLRMLLFPHLGHTSMMVTMLRFVNTIFVDVGVGANRQKYFNTRGDKQGTFFTRKI